MRHIATIGSSLLLAFLLGGAAQQRADPRAVADRLRKLATADEAAREEVLKTFDDQPTIWVLSASGLLGGAEVKEREAVRRWLPHPIWNFQGQRTVGAARKRERELLGPDPKPQPGAFVRAVLGLLEKDAPAALRLLANLRTSDPAPYLPHLSAEAPEVVRNAALAVSQTDQKPPMPELMKLFRSSPIAPSLVPALIAHGTPDLTPELVEIVATDPARAGAAVSVLEKIGDARAEPAVIKYLATCEPKASWAALNTLSLIGGPDSVEAIRKYAATLKPDDVARHTCEMALVRLRPPGHAAELIAEVRAGRKGLDRIEGTLARLGDRSIVPDLAALAGDSKRKIDERKTALELLGILGDRSQEKLLKDHLNDDRFEGSAAEALGDLANPESAAALADAMKGGSKAAWELGRAILSLPASPAVLEKPLLEILDDPDGHDAIHFVAVEVAARTGSPKVRARLAELLAKDQARSTLSRKGLAMLAASFTPADRDKLLRFPRADERRSSMFSVILASIGDQTSLVNAVKQFSEGFFREDPRDNDNALELLKADPKEMAPVVAAAFAKRRNWYDGAEWLYLHDDPRGKPLVLETAASRSVRDSERAAKALLRKGDLSLLPALLERYSSDQASPELAALLARACSPEDRERLRRSVAEMPFLLSHAAIRLLSQGEDRAMIPMFRRIVRNHFLENQMGENSNEGLAALALARAKDPEVRTDLLQSLRSSAPPRRRLAAKALAILGDRTAAAAIAPLLDDLERDRLSDEGDPYQRRPMVREGALEAIETLAGSPFKGTPAERIAAAREWATKKNQ